MMKNFLVYRNGSNAANQSMCNRMAVAIVTASDVDEARRIAEENVTFYVNQTSEAVPEEEADADDWNEVSRGAAESDQYYVG
jgi:hypothetical protein